MTGGASNIGPALGRRVVWIGLGVLAALVLPAIGVLAGVALASSAFDDVDPDGTHAQGIEWLAESGVTAGCEVGRFCPNDAVSREQMGTFLYRVSGNDPRVAPSVNAATLQGLTVAELFAAFESGELPEGLEPGDPADPTEPDGGDGPVDPGQDPDQPDEPTDPGDGDAMAALGQRVDELEAALLDLDARLTAIDGLLQAEDDGDGTLGAALVSLSVRLAAQADAIEDLEVEVEQQQATIDDLEPEVGRLAALLVGVSRETVNSQPTLRFSGMNVQVVNGDAQNRTNSSNSVGNLILGYNRLRTGQEGVNQRSGSHYLVIGDGNNYLNWGGIVAGELNAAEGEWSTVAGGSGNRAVGNYSVVAGGRGNVAGPGFYSSVSGGRDNAARSSDSSVSGGRLNEALGSSSSITGGRENRASGEQSTVTGGYRNTASGMTSSVSGGNNNEASGIQTSILGGSVGNLSGDLATSPPTSP